MMKKLLSILFVLSAFIINAQQSYYDDVDLTKTGTALKDELATKITNTHTNFLSYTPGIWEACKATDVNPDNSAEVLLIYGYSASGTTSRTRGIDQNGGNSGDWNREHTYAKSLGNPNLGESGPGADAHHLRPSDVSYNSQRGNKPFAAGSGNSGDVTGGWYPGDEWKGDVARMMMYMYLRYGNQCLPSVVGVGSSATTPDDMIDLFLQWNAEDPVSQIEDNRNTYHENTANTYAQGNRNPFIDNPFLATVIWGGPTAQDRWGISTPDTEAPTVPTGLTASNITTNTITLSWNASTDNVAVTSYEIFVDGNLLTSTNSLSQVITGLNPNTSYSLTVLAKDESGNSSAQSTSISVTTLEETTGGTGTCTAETFDNIPTTSPSSYQERTWIGDNGFQWTATDARTDQTLTGSSITIRNGSLTSAEIAGGIKSFTVKTQRVFSGGSGVFDVTVNGTKVGEIAYSDVVQETIINNIDISGNVIISLTNKASTSDRVSVDDLSWECFDATANVDEVSKLSKIKVFPNPVKNGKVNLQIPTDVEVDNIKIYSVIGKEVYSKVNPTFINNKIEINNLKSGIYLLKISNNKSSTTKKLIVQ